MRLPFMRLICNYLSMLAIELKREYLLYIGCCFTNLYTVKKFRQKLKSNVADGQKEYQIDNLPDTVVNAKSNTAIMAANMSNTGMKKIEQQQTEPLPQITLSSALLPAPEMIKRTPNYKDYLYT